MKKQLVIYLASPISENGENGRTVEENIKAASDIAVGLWAAGYAVICPANNTAFVDLPFNAGLDPEVYYEGDLAIMDRCDAIVFTPDWATSVGARAEMEYALQEQIPVYVYPHLPHPDAPLRRR